MERLFLLLVWLTEIFRPVHKTPRPTLPDQDGAGVDRPGYGGE